jgi:GT2 family glycosyltransferase
MSSLDLGIVQISSGDTKRKDLLINKIIPSCIEVSSGNYTLVSSHNEEMKNLVEELGGVFSNYTAWERDMSRKWRQGISTRNEEWVCLLGDDILLKDDWLNEMSSFLEDKEPGQYGFRLVEENGERHQMGEDWMQFPDPIRGLPHRALEYNIETGEIEQSETAYVANCVVHRDLLSKIEPFGLFQLCPDVMWSMAIRQYGFPISFNPKATAYHLGDRKDNR